MFASRVIASALVVLGLLPRFALSDEEVPPPSETPCEVIVSGRTSTLKSIVTKKVGSIIPKIHRGQRVCGNTPGFDWYVSQHYALKADIGDELASHFLTIAELAYPHYVEVIGAEPPDRDTTRMAIVHAKDLESLQKAVVSDAGAQWAGHGGGVTLPVTRAAYNFPSGSLRYHRNDLTIHEGMHLFEVSVAGKFHGPDFFVEGIAHALANHVFDPAKKQLTVAVFDKAPINNPIDQGLRLAREKGPPAIEDFLRNRAPKDFGMEGMALLTDFFWNDPDRLMKWRLWRDELLRAGLEGDASEQVSVETMRRLFGGSFAGLEREWRDWLKRRHSSFTHVDWGWEQWGGTLQSYGWPSDSRYFAQMNINYPPGDALAPDPWRMDYPRSAKSPLVGPVGLGGATPTVGCLVDFKPAQNKGWVGLGLGVDGRRLLRIVIEQNQSLVLDGGLLDLEAGRREVPFEPAFRAAARKSGRVGLTVKIAQEGIEIAACAGGGDPNARPTMSATYPLTSRERKDLLSRPMAVISRDARHEITPYFEERIPTTPDLTKPAPANPWRCAGDRQTYLLYRIAWLMGDQAPGSLVDLKRTMVEAMDQDAARQADAMAAWSSRMPRVAADLKALDTPPARRALELIEAARL